MTRIELKTQSFQVSDLEPERRPFKPCRQMLQLLLLARETEGQCWCPGRDQGRQFKDISEGGVFLRLQEKEGTRE